MSDSNNLYQAPEPSAQNTPALANSLDTMAEIQVLAGLSAPWLKFLAVMSYIGAGGMALSGLVLAIIGSSASSLMPSSIGANIFGTLGSFALGLLYIAMGLLYFFPGRFLYKMGSAAADFKITANHQDLKEFVLNVKRISKFSGILTIIGLAIIPLVFIGAFIVGMANLGALR